MLEQSDLETIRRNLEAERDKILQSFEDQKLETPLEDNPDEEDLADFVADQELRSSLEEFSECILERINQALERMDAGTYGKCQKCHGDILAERLLAMPYAEYCVDCQARLEKQAKVII